MRWSPALDPQIFPTSSWEIEQNENEKIMSLRSSMIERESCGWDEVEEGSSRSGRGDSSSRISFSFQSRAASFLPTFSISKPALSTATRYQVPLILAIALDHPRRLPLQLSPEGRSISAPFPVHLSFLPATLHIFTQPSSSSACPLLPAVHFRASKSSLTLTNWTERELAFSSTPTTVGSPTESFSPNAIWCVSSKKLLIVLSVPD